MIQVSIIGYGNLAKALAQGLRQSGAYHLRVSGPALSVGTTAGIDTHYDNLAILPQAEIIILAVKPAKVREVLQHCSPAFPDHSLLISLAAGIPLSILERECFKSQAIIRAMPNVAAHIGQSATALLANSHVSSQQKDQATALFNTIGLSDWVSDDEAINQCTALAGSGPAYVFLFMESLIDSAVKMGLPPPLAREFTLQTVQGALSLAQQSPLTLGQLRDQVTSPQGTTAAALNALAEADFRGIMDRALNAALTRARQLKG